MIRNRLTRFLRRDDGAVLVEFAMVFPVMLIFLGFVALSGHLYFSYQKAVAGVREASRFAARVAPIDVCQKGVTSPDNALTTEITNRIWNSDAGANLFPRYIRLQSVTISYDCTAHRVATSTAYAKTYRTNPPPVVVVSASLTIDLPLSNLLQFFGATATSISTTIVQNARIYGA